MDVNMPEQKAEQDTSRLEMGNIVGDLAMEYFGAYTEVPFVRGNTQKMVEETNRLIAEKVKVITEASFAYDGNFCSVDILRKIDDGFEIIEVKSSSAKSTVAKVYLHDMAYQYYVLTHCNISVKKVSLMQLNSEYIRNGELDLQELFVLTDCTDLILDMQKDIPQTINFIKDQASQGNEPECDLGVHCNNPYECLYKEWCYRNLPPNNVFDIGFRMRASEKERAYKEGIIRYEDVLQSNIKLNEHQLLQVRTMVEDLPPYVDIPQIQQFLNHLRYPIYHLDFETIQPTLPLWDGTSPYQQIPFQYSIHIQNKPGDEPLHKEFLAKEEEDPRRAVAEHLCNDIPPDVCVLAYNAGFEKGRIKELAKAFPDLEEHLLRIHANVIDLADPFSKGHYYCKEMGGSYSIKKVLPALCGNDPTLDYNNLERIHHGGEAMEAFAKLHEQPPEEIENIRAALLAYCKLDTLAMVKLLGKLYEAVPNMNIQI